MLNHTLKNRYKVTAPLGRGAMGLVYRATDQLTRQEVAVKVIAHDMAVDVEMLARFRREGEALRQLRHRNIVAFVEMFEDQGQQVIVMEYVPGGNLYTLIELGPLPAAESVRITLELSDALAQAHHIDIIHRDIKPQNVLLTPEGVPKLSDFGIARLLGAATNLTQSGVMIGTPHYMSPEAWSGEPPDAQADVWSLGVMVYQMVSGRLPFAGETLPAVMNKILTDTPPDLRTLQPETPETLVRIIDRMLARDKAQRYETMRQVAVDLEQVQKQLRRVQTVALPKAETGPGTATLAAQEDERLQAEAELKAWAAREQEAARRKAEAEQPAQAPAAAPKSETAPVGRETAQLRSALESLHRAPEAEVPKGQPPSGTRRTRVWLGVGAALICLLVAGGLGLWGAASHYLASASNTATVPSTAIVRVMVMPTNTPWPTTTAKPAPTKMAPSPTKPATATPVPTNIPATMAAPTITQTSTAAPRPSLVPTLASGNDGMALVYVPAGKFLMGSAATDSFGQKNEEPQHTVDLDAFWIDRTDVTNAMYTQCVSAGACQKPKALVSKTRPDYYTNPQYAQYPVVFVTWDDAQAYCAWAGRRLPTEAEWEKAARGTEGALYPWGNQPYDDTRGALQPAVKDTTQVGSYPAGASPYGALDMAGNVWQWVADWYDANYYASSPAHNPPGPSTGSLRILRGGSWDVVRPYVRAAVRDSYKGDVTYEVIGFRCARSP
jgi:eukaryotic-like serine/threonine-protein kinase